MDVPEKPKNGLLIVVSVVVIALLIPALLGILIWPLLLGFGLIGQ